MVQSGKNSESVTDTWTDEGEDDYGPHSRPTIPCPVAPAVPGHDYDLRVTEAVDEYEPLSEDDIIEEQPKTITLTDHPPWAFIGFWFSLLGLAEVSDRVGYRMFSLGLLIFVTSTVTAWTIFGPKVKVAL